MTTEAEHRVGVGIALVSALRSGLAGPSPTPEQLIEVAFQLFPQMKQCPAWIVQEMAETARRTS